MHSWLVSQRELCGGAGGMWQWEEITKYEKGSIKSVRTINLWHWEGTSNNAGG